jgi:hypothetical protein
VAEQGSVRITPGTIEALRFLTHSVAWEKFFVPSLEAMKAEWLQKLMDPSEARKKEHSDDYIRGCFATIDVFLSAPDVLIREADAQKEREAAQHREVESLGFRLHDGNADPTFGTLTDSAEGYEDE